MNSGVDKNWYSSFISTDHIYFSIVFWILGVFFFRVRTHINFGKHNLMKTLLGKYDLGSTLHIVMIFGHTHVSTSYSKHKIFYSYYNIRENICFNKLHMMGTSVCNTCIEVTRLYLCNTCFWKNKNITFIQYNFLFGEFRRKGDDFYARKIFSRLKNVPPPKLTK